MSNQRHIYNNNLFIYLKLQTHYELYRKTLYKLHAVTGAVAAEYSINSLDQVISFDPSMQLSCNSTNHQLIIHPHYRHPDPKRSWKGQMETNVATHFKNSAFWKFFQSALTFGLIESTNFQSYFFEVRFWDQVNAHWKRGCCSSNAIFHKGVAVKMEKSKLLPETKLFTFWLTSENVISDKISNLLIT